MTEKKLSIAERDRRLTEYGWCRGITHFWQRNGTPILREGRFYVINLYCPSCGSIRKTKIDSGGNLAGHAHSYKYPDDYKVPGLRHSKREGRMYALLKGAKEPWRTS